MSDAYFFSFISNPLPSLFAATTPVATTSGAKFKLHLLFFIIGINAFGYLEYADFTVLFISSAVKSPAGSI